MTVSCPFNKTPAFITGCLCIVSCIPGGMVMRRMVTSGWVRGYCGSGVPSQLALDFAGTGGRTAGCFFPGVWVHDPGRRPISPNATIDKRVPVKTTPSGARSFAYPPPDGLAVVSAACRVLAGKCEANLEQFRTASAVRRNIVSLAFEFFF